MFGESMLITKTEQNRPHRWMTFAASLFIHSFFIAALVITPLMDADAEMPSLTIEHIFLSSPPPPIPPPPPRGVEGRPPKPGTATAQVDPPRPKPVGTIERLFVPDFIPEEIPDEDLITGYDFDEPSGGVPGGVDTGLDLKGDELKSIFGDQIILPNSPIKTTPISTVTPPHLLRRLAPDYPKAALISRTEGMVVIQAETDVYGKVIRTVVLSGHPLLLKAAEEAVRQWIYEPYIINGVPRAVKFTVELTFTLNQQ